MDTAVKHANSFAFVAFRREFLRWSSDAFRAYRSDQTKNLIFGQCILDVAWVVFSTNTSIWGDDVAKFAINYCRSVEMRSDWDSHGAFCKDVSIGHI